MTTRLARRNGNPVQLPIGAVQAYKAAFTGQLPAAGDVMGPYRLLSEPGSGGMGAVWLAAR
jgi:hypothetical protein